jgi:hypothetical protein
MKLQEKEIYNLVLKWPHFNPSTKNNQSLYVLLTRSHFGQDAFWPNIFGQEAPLDMKPRSVLTKYVLVKKPRARYLDLHLHCFLAHLSPPYPNKVKVNSNSTISSACFYYTLYLLESFPFLLLAKERNDKYIAYSVVSNPSNSNVLVISHVEDVI